MFINGLYYWKSITYLETCLGFQMFILFIWKLFLSLKGGLCENTWMTDFANFWFGGNLREWFGGQKIFFWTWTWLYILYIGGTPAPHQGPNSHQTHFNNWPASLWAGVLTGFNNWPASLWAGVLTGFNNWPASLWAGVLTGFNKWIEWLWACLA